MNRWWPPPAALPHFRQWLELKWQVKNDSCSVIPNVIHVCLLCFVALLNQGGRRARVMFNRHQSNHFLRHKLSISLQSIKLIFKYHDNFVVPTKDCHIYKLCHRVDEKKTITMKDITCAVRAPELAESVQWLLLSHFKPNIHIPISSPTIWSKWLPIAIIHILNDKKIVL